MSLPSSSFSPRVLRCILPLIAILSPMLSASAAVERDPPILHGVHRILFLGDSITYAGDYVALVERALLTRMPTRTFEVIDLGLPSETVSGLTEPGHAGGAFPRPDLHERLDRALSQIKPDLVVACYGMNDGMYYPFAEARFAKFRQGMQDLADRVAATHAKLLLLTPPPFDPQPVRSSLLPAGRDTYPSGQTYVGYDDVLAQYSSWLMDQRKRGWNVIDIHTPINAYLAMRRKQEPTFKLAGDGVHIDRTGHYLIADMIIRYLNFAPDRLAIDARTLTVRGTGVSGLRKIGDDISFKWRVRRPLPMPPRDSQIVPITSATLAVTGLHSHVAYVVSGSNVNADSSTLKDGVALAWIGSNIGTGTLDTDVLDECIRRRQRLLTDSWLTSIGHKRPGMPTGLPLADALQKAQALDTDVHALCELHEIDISVYVVVPEPPSRVR